MEVGEYIRTKGGCICNIININEFRPPEAKICVDMNLNDYGFISEEDIKSHSKNIIDLIEVGDVVEIYLRSDIRTKGFTQKLEILSQSMLEEVKKDTTSIIK